MKYIILIAIQVIINSISFSQTKWIMVEKTNGQIDSTAIGLISSITFKTIPNTVSDVDGNIYHTVIIGNQEWTVENLQVTHYNDGTPIPIVTDNSEWANNSTGARCSYNNDSSMVPVFGYLYNWYAVSTGKLAPATGGWRVPTDADWTTLTNFAGEPIAGTKLKSKLGWGVNGTDDYGFFALPGGLRDSYNPSSFNYNGIYGAWWSSSPFDQNNGLHRSMTDNDNFVYRGSGYGKSGGFSVRLIRDL